MKAQDRSCGNERNYDLSDSALVVLSEAAGRKKRMVLPLPASVRIHGGAKDKELRKLRRLELIEDVPAAEAEHAWWTGDDGRRVALRISARGLPAIGVEEDAEIVRGRSASADQLEANSLALTEHGDRREGRFEDSVGGSSDATVDLKSRTAARPLVRPGSKQALLVDCLSSDGGSTLDELVEQLGWQRHTVRAALTGLRHKGFRVTKSSRRRGRPAIAHLLEPMKRISARMPLV